MSKIFTTSQQKVLSDFKNGKLRRINLLDGSVRSGKTWISLVLWTLFVATKDKDDTFLMVGKTLSTLKRNCLDVLISLVGKQNFYYSLSKKEAILCGRKIYLEGASDTRSESKIRGMTLCGAYCDELTLFNEEFFTMLLSRLSKKDAKLFATTNPDNPSHWLYKRYIKRKDELENSEILFAMNEIITTLELNDSFSFFSLKVNTGRFLLAFLRDSYTRSPSSFDMFSVSENLAKIIQKAVDYININFRNDITADEAAKFVGLSYNYFSNCFSKIVGQTFRQYLNKTRINHAKHLLLCSNRNISEVADDVGYNSVSYFILEFRRESGMTPAKFVKKFKYRSEN